MVYFSIQTPGRWLKPRVLPAPHQPATDPGHHSCRAGGQSQPTTNQKKNKLIIKIYEKDFISGDAACDARREVRICVASFQQVPQPKGILLGTLKERGSSSSQKQKDSFFKTSTELKFDARYHTALPRPKIQTGSCSLREYPQKGHLLLFLFSSALSSRIHCWALSETGCGETSL